MTNDYLEAIGVWEHKIGNITHVFEPTMLDNEQVKRIMTSYTKNKDFSLLLTKLGEYYFTLCEKAYPELNDEQKNNLKLWISAKQLQICEDIQISHGWLNQGDLEKAKQKFGDEGGLKNLM